MHIAMCVSPPLLNRMRSDEHSSVCLDTENYCTMPNACGTRQKFPTSFCIGTDSGGSSAVLCSSLSCCQMGPEGGRNADVVFLSLVSTC